MFIDIEDKFADGIHIPERLGISERTVRNWRSEGKMDGAFLTGKTWNIPKDASIPQRKAAVMDYFKIKRG